MIFMGIKKAEAAAKRRPAEEAVWAALRPLINNHALCNKAYLAVLAELEKAGVIPAIQEK